MSETKEDAPKKKIKLKWKVEPAPTGPYRSFTKRGWPSLMLGEWLAATIICKDAYYPSAARNGSHAPLRVLVYNHSEGIQKRKSLVSKAEFATLDEAKQWTEKVFRDHPEWLPKQDN